MNKREALKRPVSFLKSALMIALLTGIYMYVWTSFYKNTGDTYFIRGNYVIVGLYGVLLIAAYRIAGAFQGGRQFFDLLYAQGVALLCVNGITYLQLGLIYNWAFLENVGPILMMTLADLLAILVWTALTFLLTRKLYPPEKLLVIYGKMHPETILRKLALRPDRFAVAEAIHAEEDIEILKAKILEHGAVLLADIQSATRNKLLKFCYEKDIRCYSIPKITDIMVMSAERLHPFDTTLLLFHNRGLSFDQRLVKRLFDIFVSLVGILITLPLMLLIALCIKLCDRGPVFYTQDRLTRGGKIFKVYKFRSMRVEPKDAQVTMTKKGDERITPIGKLIRNTHTDELPQLFNVLKGDMSIVGPRPERPEIAEQYYKRIPEFSYRLKVKGGLTGYAQVYGSYNTVPYDKLKLDLTYIENYSFLLDIKLIIMTFRALVQNENVVGIEKHQTTASNDEEELKL